MINAADLDPFFHPAMSPGATSPRDTAHLGGMLEVGLHFRNSCQHDHGLASLIFRSRSDLIAGQIEGDAISLIGGRKMQRLPVDHDPSGAHAEKTAEIDHGSQYLSALIDQDIDDASQVLLGTAADLLAEHCLNALIGQDRLPRVLVVIGVRGGCARTAAEDFPRRYAYFTAALVSSAERATGSSRQRRAKLRGAFEIFRLLPCRSSPQGRT